MHHRVPGRRVFLLPREGVDCGTVGKVERGRWPRIPGVVR